MRDYFPENKVKTVCHLGEIIPARFNSPRYLNNSVCDIIFPTRQQFFVVFLLFFWTALFLQNSTDVMKDQAFACCNTGQTITEQLLRGFSDRGECITQQAADSVS